MSLSGGRSTPMSVTYRRLADAQKSSAGVALYSRWINRPLGRLLAVPAHRIGLTPNQVTALSALATAAGIVVLAVGGPSWPTAAGASGLLVLGYALDSADGQVARLRGGGRPSGEWLDHVFDAFKAIAVHAAVLVHWYVHLDVSAALLLVPLAFATVSGTWFFAEILTQLLERLHPREGTAPRRRPAWQPVLALPADHGVLSVSFVLLAVPAAWVPVYIVLAVLNGLMLLRQLRSWYKRVDALTPTP